MMLVWRIIGKRMLPLSSKRIRDAELSPKAPLFPVSSCRRVAARKTDIRGTGEMWPELCRNLCNHSSTALQRLSGRAKCSQLSSAPHSQSSPARATSAHHLSPQALSQYVCPDRQLSGCNTRLLNMDGISRCSQIQNIMTSNRQKSYLVFNAMTSQSNRLHVTWGTRPGSSMNA